MNDSSKTSKKFAIIGLPGSGKSTFATKLGKILDIPVHHLDRHMFEPGGKKETNKSLLPSKKRSSMSLPGSWKGALFRPLRCGLLKLIFSSTFISQDFFAISEFLNGFSTIRKSMVVSASSHGSY